MSVTRSILAIAVPVLAIAACSADLQDMNAPYAVARSWCEKRASCGDPTVGDQDECINSTESLARNGGRSSFISTTPTTEDKDRLFACADSVREGSCPAQFGPLPPNCGFSPSFSADTGTSDTGTSDTESSDTSSSETSTPVCRDLEKSCVVDPPSTGPGRLYDCTIPPAGCSRVSFSTYCCPVPA